ncbi:hypothetical protein GCM10028895_02110 [Pontibacter rugosus]
MIKKYFLIGLLAVFMRPAFAQEPASGGVKVLTLEESIQYALSNNQDVKKPATTSKSVASRSEKPEARDYRK